MGPWTVQLLAMTWKHFLQCTRLEGGLFLFLEFLFAMLVCFSLNQERAKIIPAEHRKQRFPAESVTKAQLPETMPLIFAPNYTIIEQMMSLGTQGTSFPETKGFRTVGEGLSYMNRHFGKVKMLRPMVLFRNFKKDQTDVPQQLAFRVVVHSKISSYAKGRFAASRLNYTATGILSTQMQVTCILLNYWLRERNASHVGAPCNVPSLKTPDVDGGHKPGAANDSAGNVTGTTMDGGRTSSPNPAAAGDNVTDVSGTAQTDAANATKRVSESQWDSFRLQMMPTLDIVCLLNLKPTRLFDIGWILVFAFTLGFTCKLLAREKISHLQGSLKLMGMSVSAYWLSWLLWKMLLGSLVSVVLTYTLTTGSSTNSAIINYSSFRIFVWLFVYYIDLLTFSFVCSLLVNNENFAFWTCFIVYASVQLAGIPNFLTKSYLKLIISGACLFEVGNYVTKAVILESNDLVGGNGIQLEHLFIKDKMTMASFTYWRGIWLILLNIGFNAFLLWYGLNLRPDAGGHSLPFYFFLKPSFWFPRTQSVPDLPPHDQKLFEPPGAGLKLSIALNEVVKVYGNHAAVAGVNMQIYTDQVTVFLGPNHSGLSTLLGLIAGATQATRGNVTLNEIDVGKERDNLLMGIGYCPQNNIIFPSLTCLQHLDLYHQVRGERPVGRKKEFTELLKCFGLQEARNQKASDLTDAQKKFLSVSCAFAGYPKVVLLDEPTVGLDRISRADLWTFLKTKCIERTIVVTCHSLHEADLFADKMALVVNGQIRCYGTPLYLRSIFGIGYNLNVGKGDNCNEAEVTKLLQGVIPTARSLGGKGADIVYCLPAVQDGAAMTQMFKSLESQMSALKVRTVSLLLITMEEAYLGIVSGRDVPTYPLTGVAAAKVVARISSPVDKSTTNVLPSESIPVLEKTTDANLKDQNANRLPPPSTPPKPPHKSVHKSAHKPAHKPSPTPAPKPAPKPVPPAPHKPAPAPAAVKPSAPASGGAPKPSAPAVGAPKPAPPPVPKVPKPPSKFCLQFQAVLNKRVVLLKRNAVVTGLVLATVLMTTLNTRNPDVAQYTSVDPEDFSLGRNCVAFLKVEPAAPATFADAYRSQVAGLSTVVDIEPDADVAAFISAWEGVKSKEEYSLVRVGAVLTENLTSSTALYHAKPPHTEALSLQLLLNAYIAHLLDGNYSIQSGVHPVEEESFTKKSLPQRVTQVSMPIITIFFNCCLFGVFLLCGLVEERATGVRTLQSMTGIWPIAYWVANCLIDYGLYLAVMILIIVFNVIQPYLLISQGRYWLTGCTLFLYGLALVPHLYVFYKVFKDVVTAVIIYVMVNLFVVGMSFFLMIEGQPNLLGLWALVCPTGLLVNCISLICVTASLIDVNGSAGTPQKQELVSEIYSMWAKLAGLFSFNWCFLMFLEHKLHRTLWYKSCGGILTCLSSGRTKASDVEQEGIFNANDSDVVEERELVRRGSHKELGSTHPVLLINVSKKYCRCSSCKTVCVLYPTSFAIQPKEIFGLVGSGGSGKSTLLKMLSGGAVITSGKAYVHGCSIKNDVRNANCVMGMSLQKNALHGRLTGRETLYLFGRLRGLNDKMIDEAVDKIITELNLAVDANVKTHSYSHASKKKMNVGIALIGHPKVLLMDEPTLGLDVATSRQIWNLLTKLKDEGHSILVTTKSLSECEDFCTRMAVIVQGHLMCIGTPAKIKAKFVKGYTLTVVIRRDVERKIEHEKEVIAKVKFTFKGALVYNKIELSINFQLPGSIPLSQMFAAMEKLKAELQLDTYIIHQAALDKVFNMMINGD